MFEYDLAHHNKLLRLAEARRSINVATIGTVFFIWWIYKYNWRVIKDIAAKKILRSKIFWFIITIALRIFFKLFLIFALMNFGYNWTPSGEVKNENERILTDDNGNEVKGTQEEILDLLIPILNSDPEMWDYKITDDGKLVDPLSNDALLSNNAKEYLWNRLTQDGLGGTWFAKEI